MNLLIEPTQVFGVAGETSITTFRHIGDETFDLFYTLEIVGGIKDLDSIDVRVTNQGVVLYPLDDKQSNLIIEELSSEESLIVR